MILKTDKRKTGDHLVITLQGELSLYVVSETRKDIQNEIGSITGSLILDCRNLKLIDSSGIGLLIQLQRQQEAIRRGTFWLAGVPNHIQRILRIVSLDGYFRFGDTVDEVIEKQELILRPAAE